MKKIYIVDAEGESIEKSGFKILDFLAGETHFYKYGLNLHDPDGKAWFYEYDKVQGVYDMKKYGKSKICFRRMGLSKKK